MFPPIVTTVAGIFWISYKKTDFIGDSKRACDRLNLESAEFRLRLLLPPHLSKSFISKKAAWLSPTGHCQTGGGSSPHRTCDQGQLFSVGYCKAALPLPAQFRPFRMRKSEKTLSQGKGWDGAGCGRRERPLCVQQRHKKIGLDIAACGHRGGIQIGSGPAIELPQ